MKHNFNSNHGGTASQAHFSEAVHADIQRSTLMRNSTVKTTFNCGDLVPVYLDEILPGDTFEMDMAFVSRLTTPIFPTMDTLSLDFYAFFVPNRLTWIGWQALQGENKTGAWTPATPPALVPVLVAPTSPTQVSKRIGDYLGIPVGMNYGFNPTSVLPFRAYALIWNEWFRDQNTQAPIVVSTSNTGEDNTQAYTANAELLKTNKKHEVK